MNRTILAILGLSTIANGVNLTNSLGAQAADDDCGCNGCGGNKVDIDIQFLVNSGGAVGAGDSEEDNQAGTGEESLASTASEEALAGVTAGTDAAGSSTTTTTTTTTSSSTEEDLASTAA
jgi:hypothetical protein